MKKCIVIFLLFLYKMIDKIILCFLVIILLISGYAIYDSYQLYEGVKIDSYLESVVLEDDSFDKLTNINNKIVGFIEIYDTSIKYPILKGKDNTEYLNKNYKDEYSFSGSIFLDYRNNNFKDDYSVIYGHNLYRGGMFSDIKKYKDKNFFNNHLNGLLITKNGKYEIEIISLSKVKTSDEIVYNFNKFKKDKIIDFILSKSINKNKINNYDKYLILSTCMSSRSPNRLILLCGLKNSS